MLKNLLYILLLVAFACSIGSCNQREGNKLNVADSELYDGNFQIDPAVIDTMVQNISSPVEMAALIKSLGVPFQRKYLAPTDYVDNYNAGYVKSYTLGMFAADLGYLNMYNKTSSVLEYLSAIKKLADGLNIGQFFDFNTMKRIVTNNTDLDSLMYISVRSFNDMDSYLRKNRRSSYSSLIVAGVWLEGLYLATQVAKDYPSSEIAQGIAEQKTVLDQLMIVLKNYDKDADIAVIIKEFETIKKEFEPITITVEVGEPTTVEKNGMLTIVQNSHTIVNITDDQLKKIIAQAEKVRNKLIKS